MCQLAPRTRLVPNPNYPSKHMTSETHNIRPTAPPRILLIFNACLCLCPRGQLYTISERDAPSLPLVIRAARSVPLLRSLVPFLEVALRPPYLSDVHPQRLKCPAVLESEEHGYWLGQTRYEDRVIAELERQEAEGYRQQWPLMKDVNFERAPKVRRLACNQSTRQLSHF